MKTHQVTPDQIARRWYLVDAEGQTLGRLASRVAQILRGKHKPIYTPHMDTGDHVLVDQRGEGAVDGQEARPEALLSRHPYPGGSRKRRSGACSRRTRSGWSSSRSGE